MKRFLSLALAILMVFSMMPQITIGAKAASTKTVYFQNNWLWTDVCYYYWNDGSNSWPGDAMTKVGNDGTYDIYKAVIPANAYVIFNGIKNDGSGSRDQTPDITAPVACAVYYMHWDGANQVGTLADKKHANTTTTTVDATCTADGSVTVTCDDCGATISSTTTEKTGHDWSNLDGVCAYGCGTECDHAGMTTADEVCGTCGMTNPDYVAPVNYITLYYNDYCVDIDDEGDVYSGSYLELEDDTVELVFCDSSYKEISSYPLELVYDWIYKTEDVDATLLTTAACVCVAASNKYSSLLAALPTAGDMIISFSNADSAMVWSAYPNSDYPIPEDCGFSGHIYKDGTCSACGAADPDAQPTTVTVYFDNSEAQWENVYIAHGSGDSIAEMLDSITLMTKGENDIWSAEISKDSAQLGFANGTTLSAVTYGPFAVEDGKTYKYEAPKTIVAKIGDTEYTSLAAAVSAASAGAVITVVADSTEDSLIPIAKNLSIDLGGKTVNLPGLFITNGTVEISNGTLIGTSSSYSTVQLNTPMGLGAPVATLTNVNVTGARHAVRVEGGTATINGGTYVAAGAGTTHAVNVGGDYASTVTIKGGKFIGPKDTSADSGSALSVQANGTVTVEDGEFSGGKLSTLANKGTLSITGGTYDQDPSAYVAEGYEATETDGTWAVAMGWYDPNATEYHITCEEDLWAFAEAALASNDAFSGKTVYLDADIDLNWAEWTAINFKGDLEGGNHTIKNLTYVANSANRMGFFQNFTSTVKNLTLDGIKGTVPANGRFGGFTRYLDGVAENVHVKNIEVTTTDVLAWVGGFTTYTSGGRTVDCSVENLTVDATAGADLIAGFAALTANRQLYENSDVKGFKVTVADAADGCGVGGWAAQTQTGWNNPKFVGCDVTGIDVTATGLVDVGGFIAWPGAHTEYANNCTTEGKIDVTGVTSTSCFAGGFFGNLGWNCDLGYMGHVLNNCSADVDIITKVADAGGFVGSATNSNNSSMYATFNNCSASGNVTVVEGGTADVGGFAGSADRGVYENCSASGTVTNNGTGYAGQYIGAIYDVTPKYDSRYPAGTREYPVEEITIDGCTYTGASELNFIGNIDSAKPAEEVIIVNYVAQIGETKYDSLQAAVAAAEAGETVKLLKDVETGTASLEINKAITLDLGGKTLTTNGTYGGLRLKGGCSLKNGTLAHKGTVVAIKAWDVASIEDVVIDVAFKAEGKTIGGISVQENAVGIDTIKNVTIKGEGLTYGIETYNCGNAAEPVIGSMENVTIDAKSTGMLLSAPCGTVKNSSISGGTSGIEIWIKGTYSATLDLANSTVTGGTQAVYAHDEFSSNPDIENKGTLKMTVDAATKLVNENTGALLTLTIARAENVDLSQVIAKAVAQVENNDTTATYYDTLQDAINACTGGETVTLLADITEDVTVDKSITIDGAGKNYTGNISVSGTSTAATVKNVNFVDGTGYAITTNRIKSITVENCTVANYGFGFLYANKSTPTVVVKDVTVSNVNYGIHWVYGTSATLENVKMTNAAIGLYIQNYAAKTITMTNCEISGTNPIYVWEKATAVQTFNFVGANTLTDTDSDTAISTYGELVLTEETATLAAAEGLNVTTTVADRKVVYEEGIYKVVPKVYVAQVGETKYDSLQDAINACTGGETVTLLADITYTAEDAVPAHGGGTGFGTYDQYNPAVIYTGGTRVDNVNSPSTVNAVLDLNGHTITSSADAYVFLIMDNTKLTFTDSVGTGSITTTAEVPVIWAVGTDTLVTVKSGVYTTASAEGLLWSTHGADMVITGGEFKTTADDASLLIIRNAQDRKNPAYFIDGKATIEITGGTYHGFNPEQTPDDSTSPFTYFNAVAEGYVAEAVEGAENTWTVVEFDYVQWIKEQLLAGNDVTLERDIVVDGSYIDSISNAVNGNGKYANYGIFNVYGDTVTFDLNGHSITYNGHADFACGENDKFTGNSCTVAHGLFMVNAGANLTIKGEGSVNVNGLASGVYSCSPDSVATIEGGTWTNKGCAECGGTNLFMYASHGGELYIKAGTFEQLDGYLLVEHGGEYKNSVIDYAKTKIVVTGGTFIGMNPEVACYFFTDASNKTDLTGTKNVCAEGYVAEAVEGAENTWTVVEFDYVQWIKEQLLAGNDVTLEKDIVVDGSYIESIPNAVNGNGKYPNYGIFNVYGDTVTFDLNGHTITYNGHADFQWKGKTYNSCTVAHGLFFANAGADLTVKDSSADKTGTVMVYGLASGAYVASPDTTFTITGGTWKNEGCAECGGTNLFLYPLQGGELYISGGYFEQALDSNGESYLIVEHGGEYKNSVIDYAKTKIEITGGTFVGMNPEEARYFFTDASNKTDLTGVKNVCAEGYKAEETSDGVYNVVPNQIFEFHLTDANGEAHWLSPMRSNNLNSLIEAGKVWYDSLQGTYDFTLKITESCNLSETAIVNFPMTIDLCGNTITSASIPAIRITNGADVTVKNGTMETTGYCFILGASDGTSAGNLTIESGTYTGNVTAASVTKGVLTINGGVFAVSESDYGATYLLNCIDANYKDGSAKIVVKGGTYTGFDPENNAAEGAGTNFCADGYISVDNGDGTYTVIDYIQWIKEQLLAGNDVTLEKDIVVDYSYVESIPCTANGNGQYDSWGVFNVISGNVTFDLNGHNVTFEDHSDKFCNKIAFALFYANNGGKLTVVGDGNITVNGMATAAYSTCVGSELTIKGGNWVNNPCKECDAWNIFLYASHGGALYIKDGTFNQAVEDSYLIVEHTGYVSNNDALVDYSKTVVEVTGGTFVGMNPEEARSCNQKTWNNQEWGTTNVVAEGYVAVAADGAENTWTVVTAEAAGYVAQNTTTGEYFTTVVAAEAAANSGETIILIADVEEASLMMLNSATLDLNGHKLTVAHVAAFAGSHIVDSVGGGLLKAPRGYVMLQQNNLNLPIWDAANEGYVFADLNKFNEMTTTGTNSVKYLFLPYLDAAEYALIGQGAEASGVTLKVHVTWTSANGMPAFADFVYTDELMKQFVDLYETDRKAFSLTLTGTDAVSDLAFQVYFVSERGVQFSCN